MKHIRSIAAVAGTSVVLGLAALTAVVIADDDGARTVSPAHAEFVEPTDAPVRDGTYLGYVRKTEPGGTAVWVDFVALTNGAVKNARPARRIDGGPLVNVDVFDRRTQPFRIVIEDGTIIEVQSTDDIPEPTPTKRADAGSLDWSFRDGTLSVTVAGRSYDIPDAIADAVADAIGRYTDGDGDAGDDGERVDIAKWLAEHPAVADAVADIAVFEAGGDRIDVQKWIAEHETVSDGEWWSLEKRLLRAVIGSLRASS